MSKMNKLSLNNEKKDEVLSLPYHEINDDINIIEKKDDNSNYLFKLDKLGPIVLNKDGSMSRISNWHEMTKQEQEKTHKMLIKRNKKRKEELMKKNI